ncbi:MAG: hypothetical protein LBR66_06285, partial [Candidatus Symbiothrix sp.]|nr:hypothetical protein [Candidatus Symbiothrix sp.]
MMTGQKVSRRQFLQSALLGVGSLLLAQSPLKIFAVVKPERQEGQNEPNISSQEADTLYRRAKTLFYDRRYAEATAIYQQLIAAFPTCVRYYDGLARVLGGQQLLFEKTAAYLNDELQYEMTYHPNGNIHTKTDVGEYAYYLPQPHAMSGIVGEASAAVTNEIQEISYTAFNKVCSIDQDNDRYLIYYGLDEQRIKTEYYYADSLRHTRYYLGAYELDIDSAGNETPVNYVYAPSGLIAIVQSNEIYYVHTDHLGSLQALTGNIVSEYAYTPWGGRILLTGANLTDRGYTGHEHLPVLGLINMNGRIYDPTFARFLSPDPFVQAPNFSQSFNRYSYCLNNPLRYTDPDGENPIIAAIIIGAAAGAGGYTGYKIADAKGYDFSNWQTYGYILGGAVIGGASGYLGATIAAGGGFMANTMGIMYSSAFNSMGMTALSGGMMSPSISFGVASYDFGTGEWGYLGKKGNKWYQNLGYGLGALANLKDINDIINSTAARVYTQKQYPQDDGGGKDYKISHTSVV